jgi:hypothetical protein
VSGRAFIGTAASHAWGTFSYLVAYRFVIGLAPAVSVLAQGILRPAQILPAPSFRWWRALLLGIATSPRTSAISPRLGTLAVRMSGAPALAALLVGVHFLTPYHLLLTGPLLGKDVLLSHLIGTALCFAIVASMWGSATVVRCPRGPETRDEAVARLALLEIAGTGPQVVGGLVLAGVVGAWGLSPARVELATLFGGGLAAQVANAAAGTLLGMASCLPPVANLLVATYLWKTGIAHAGLVSFVLASAATLTRRRLYRATLGDDAGSRLWWAFLAAGFLAGIGTAIAFRALGLTIHYRLMREQLL